MSFSGFLFLFLGVALATAVALRSQLIGWRMMPFVMFIWHTGFCIYYWWGTLGAPDPDSLKYFSTAMYDMPFGAGADFIYWLTSAMTKVFALIDATPTYLDFFIIFNLAGYAGQLLIFLTLQEIAGPARRRLYLYCLIMVFLPGISFWTAALGKDSLIFLAVSLMVWGSMNLKVRYLGFAAGLALTFLVRPQTGILALGAAAIPFLTDRRLNLVFRLGGAALAAITLVALLPIFAQVVRLSSIDVATISEFISDQRGYNLEGGSSVDIQSLSPPMRVFTYLFRPLFFDAHGFLALALSVENTVLLGLTLYALWTGRAGWRKAIGQPAVLFNLAFFAMGLLLASQTTSNLGIAARQKMSIMPSLFAVLITILREHMIIDFVKLLKTQVSSKLGLLKSATPGWPRAR